MKREFPPATWAFTGSNPTMHFGEDPHTLDGQSERIRGENSWQPRQAELMGVKEK
jgi:hypothetical protein